jgi:hypothetical protein
VSRSIINASDRPAIFVGLKTKVHTAITTFSVGSYRQML